MNLIILIVILMMISLMNLNFMGRTNCEIGHAHAHEHENVVPLLPGVKGIECLLEVRSAHMGVAVGAADACVSEHLLDDP